MEYTPTKKKRYYGQNPKIVRVCLTMSHDIQCQYLQVLDYYCMFKILSTIWELYTRHIKIFYMIFRRKHVISLQNYT